MLSVSDSEMVEPDAAETAALTDVTSVAAWAELTGDPADHNAALRSFLHQLGASPDDSLRTLASMTEVLRLSTEFLRLRFSEPKRR